MHLEPQNFDLPKTCISGGCKSADTRVVQCLAREWLPFLCVTSGDDIEAQ
jgi:hypothetical protein